LEVRAGDVAMGEELGDVGSYREVHVEFFLAQLQGEVTAFEEDQKTMFVCLAELSICGRCQHNQKAEGWTINSQLHSFETEKSSSF
jgi:hypothetical protein